MRIPLRYNSRRSLSPKGLLCAHDAVAQKDYYPRLPDIPLEVDEDEETVKIVQLVKSNEPLVRLIDRWIDVVWENNIFLFKKIFFGMSFTRLTERESGRESLTEVGRSSIRVSYSRVCVFSKKSLGKESQIAVNIQPESKRFRPRTCLHLASTCMRDA